MRKAKKCPKRAKKSFDTEKIILVAACAAIFMILPLAKTGLHRNIARFFNFQGLVATQLAFDVHCGKIIAGFADRAVRDAGESMRILGEAHGRFIARVTPVPPKDVPTPFAIGAAFFEENARGTVEFFLPLVRDFRTTIIGWKDIVSLAFENWEKKSDFAIYYAAKDVTLASEKLYYNAVFAKQP